MSTSGIDAFDRTLSVTHAWLNQIMDRLGTTDRQASYRHLRAVLHALRDRLSVEQAAALSSQLPLLIRGIFFEGWKPHGKPLNIRHADEFLDVIAREMAAGDLDPEPVTRAVLDVLSEHISAGEVRHLKQSLPKEIRSLFAEEYHTLWF